MYVLEDEELQVVNIELTHNLTAWQLPCFEVGWQKRLSGEVHASGLIKIVWKENLHFGKS